MTSKFLDASSLNQNLLTWDTAGGHPTLSLRALIPVGSNSSSKQDLELELE
jgi:hypothetical protein